METENTRKYTKSQAELAEQASSYMFEHMDKKITISELSEMMHVSQTQLKNSFRNYYGNSVYKYIRSRKMQKAASEYGVSPSSYRKQHRVRSFPTQLPKTSQAQHLA